MTYLLVQIALLLLGAYLLGALIGCVGRRLQDYLFGNDDTVKTDRLAAAGVAPVIEVSNPDAEAGGKQSRFERALSQGPEASQTGGAQPSPSGVEAQSSPTETVQLDTPSFTPVADPSPSREEPSTQDDAASSSAPSSDAQDVSPSPVETSQTKTEPADKVDEGEPFSSVSVAAAAAAAAIAARAGQAHEKTVPEPDVAPAPTAETSAMVMSDDQQDLTRIKGIDRDLERQLYEVEVGRYEHIAAWTADDVSQVESLLGSPGRVSRENWIEQAQILSSGGLTEFARERDAGGGDGSGGGSDSGGSPGQWESPASSPDTSSESMDLSDTPSDSAGDASSQDVSGSDASDTSGDGSELKTTASANSTSVAAVAAAAATATATAATMAAATATSAMSSSSVPSESAEPEEVAPPVTSEPPADREMQPGADDVSEDDAANLSGFRSVRSAALRGGVGAVLGNDYDDLKRIRGVGILIEKKLNSLGVTSYQHVANWTNEDIERISQQLEFKGRIQRENWVEQARILSSGGATEFSRRMDRKMD